MDPIKECMNMIAYSGEAKTLILQAIKESREGDSESSQNLLKKADESLIKSHQAHTNLLVHDANGNDLNVTILMVHSADHLNSAEIIRILADEIIYLHQTQKGGQS